MTAEITLVVADDHAAFREGLQTILRAEGFTVLGQAADVPTTVALTQQLNPDLVLTDAQMPGGSPTDLVRGLREAAPQTKIVMLTMFTHTRLVDELEGLGISGYLVKTVNRKTLGAALRSIAHGADAVRVMPRGVDPVRTATFNLTPKEVEVLRLLGRSHSNRQISQALDMSEATVRRHLTHIYTKLQATSRVEAIATALREGIIREPG